MPPFPITADQIKELDASNYLDLLTTFADQFEEAAKIAGEIALSLGGREIRNVVVAGMGGSAIGGDLLRTYLADLVDLPILVSRQYSLPRFVGPETLVFLSSYSGDTEETLAVSREAIARRCFVVCIASGGALADLAAREGFPLIRIPGGYPPRAALGYSFVCMLISMSRLGFMADQAGELSETGRLIRQKAQEYALSTPVEKNLAKQIALKLQGRYPVIYTWGRRFEAVAIRWRGQLAEVSKQLSSHHLFPEMNHNEIVGWRNPEKLLGETAIILLRDDQEPQRIRRRLEITEELIGPSAAEVIHVWATGQNLLARLFSLVYLGDFVSFYLAALNGVDPTPVPRIEELKRRLADEK